MKGASTVHTPVVCGCGGGVGERGVAEEWGGGDEVRFKWAGGRHAKGRG